MTRTLAFLLFLQLMAYSYRYQLPTNGSPGFLPCCKGDNSEWPNRLDFDASSLSYAARSIGQHISSARSNGVGPSADSHRVDSNADPRAPFVRAGYFSSGLSSARDHHAIASAHRVHNSRAESITRIGADTAIRNERERRS